MDFKNELSNIVKRLEALEAPARKLQNKNLADIAVAARGSVMKLIAHPDLHLVEDEEKEPLPFDPNAGAGVDAAAYGNNEPKPAGTVI